MGKLKKIKVLINNDKTKNRNKILSTRELPEDSSLPLIKINLYFSLHLKLKDIYATGFGGFVVDRSELDLRALTFDLDLNFPLLDISCGKL